jgi:hypothetical protein
MANITMPNNAFHHPVITAKAFAEHPQALGLPRVNQLNRDASNPTIAKAMAIAPSIQYLLALKLPLFCTAEIMDNYVKPIFPGPFPIPRIVLWH